MARDALLRLLNQKEKSLTELFVFVGQKFRRRSTNEIVRVVSKRNQSGEPPSASLTVDGRPKSILTIKLDQLLDTAQFEQLES